MGWPTIRLWSPLRLTLDLPASLPFPEAAVASLDAMRKAITASHFLSVEDAGHKGSRYFPGHVSQACFIFPIGGNEPRFVAHDALLQIDI